MKKNVLIVDDEKEILRSLNYSFEKYKSKFQVAYASNIEKAKEVIDSFRVDTVVTDVKMPGGSGIDLLLHLRKTNPLIKVIIMTGYGDPEMKRSVLYSGAFAYFDKPLDNEELGKAIIRSFEHDTKDDFLKNLSLLEILQFMSLSRYTGSVIVRTTKKEAGYIHMVSGQVVSAETKEESGVHAISQMVLWKNPEINSVKLQNVDQTEPIGNMQSILMQVAKIVDEMSHTGAKH